MFIEWPYKGFERFTLGSWLLQQIFGVFKSFSERCLGGFEGLREFHAGLTEIEGFLRVCIGVLQLCRRFAERERERERVLEFLIWVLW